MLNILHPLIITLARDGQPRQPRVQLPRRNAVQDGHQPLRDRPRHTQVRHARQGRGDRVLDRADDTGRRENGALGARGERATFASDISSSTKYLFHRKKCIIFATEVDEMAYRGVGGESVPVAHDDAASLGPGQRDVDAPGTGNILLQF